MENVCRRKVEGSDGQQACATSVPRDARRSDHPIQRYKTVHDGKAAYPRIKNKRPSNKMLSFGETAVWMMLKDNHTRNKLDSIHQFGVFAGIVPRT